MYIKWHGHACFEISNGTTLVTDPHDGKSIGIRPPDVEANIVTMSHDHFDHNCSRIVRGKDIEVITGPDAVEIGGVKISGIPTFHDEEKGAKRGSNIIFKFELDGVRFCHCGDLGEIITDEQAASIGEVDVLFIPVGGTFTVDAEGAWQVIDKIRPKVIVPMHFRFGGLSLSIAPIDAFLELAGSRSGGHEVIKVGNEIEFSKEDLDGGQPVWVFSL